MKVKLPFVLLTLFLIPALAACGPAAEEPLPNPEAGDLPPEAVLEARTALAIELVIPVEEIGIGTFEQAEWSDSCLGLGGPAESCLAVITPGWRVELTANGKTYIARTDELGQTVRFEGMEPLVPGAPEELPPDVAAKAQDALARRLDLPVSQVEIISWEETEWPDGCLGLPEEGEMCTMAIVPGWRVELFAEGQTYIARTDQAGDVIRFEE
jgi:hypothetical protein